MRERTPTSTAGRSSSHGFSLAELLVVMVILAVVTGLVLPKLSGVFAQEDLKTSLRRLSAVVGKAREESIISGQPWMVVFDLDSGEFWPRPVSEELDRDNDGIRDEDMTQTLPEDVRIAGIQAGQRESAVTGREVVRVTPLGEVEPCYLQLKARELWIKVVAIRSFGGRLQIMDEDNAPEFLDAF